MKDILHSCRIRIYPALFFVLLMIASLPVYAKSPQPRILQAINDQNLIQLKGNTPIFARAKNDLGLASDDLVLRHVQLLLKRSDAQEAELQTLLKEQQQRGSANFHKWLTPEEFGLRFGVADADIGKISSWLSSHGLEVESVSKSRMLITFTGTHEQLRSAFHTELHQYMVNGENHVANANDLKIPTALYPVVSGIASLTNVGARPLHTTPLIASKAKGGKWEVSRQTAAPQSSLGSNLQPQVAANLFGESWQFMGPGDFNAIYNVNPLWAQGIDGTGQRIAIVAQSDINPADVDSFRAAFGLPETKLNVIYANENPGQTGGGVESEALLDVQWAGAIAKNATIDLVVGGDTLTTQGVLLAMIYAVDNNVAPILSVSWGLCELGMGTAGNQFYSSLWQQAAAQGISVLVASGDAGAATCDQGWYYSMYGEQVNGMASTPYNTAVGGTDFSVNFDHQSDYWNSENDPVTLTSAKGYIPETPWNESCASPQVLAAVQVLGFSGTTHEALCNDPDWQMVFTRVVGGGGGASNCTVSPGGDPSTCSGGYPAPVWQANMPGASSGVRRLPDLSFFSGSGLWGTALLFCQSNATPNGTCTYTDETVMYLASGGTSFATPAFAGVLALLNHKTNSSQGNINPILYEIGAQQYNGTLSGIFHDITEGNNAQPCDATIPSIAVPPSTPCTVSDPNNFFGVLPDFAAGTGYDMATGLGSVDVTKLADAWASVVSSLATTETTLTLTSPGTVVYGTPINTTVRVTTSTGSEVPAGLVSLLAGSRTLSFTELTAGTADLSGNGMNAGSHLLVAHYAGDGTFAPSTSATVPLTVTQATTSLAVAASRQSVGPGENVSLVMLVKTGSRGDSPSGTVVVTNTTTGATYTSPVTASTDASTGDPVGRAFVTIEGRQLSDGSNTFDVSYSGDVNYTASSGAQTVSYTGPFSVTLSPASLTMAPGATTDNTVVITLVPNPGAVLDAATISLQCPGPLPSGLACSFSAPLKAADGTVTSTLTVLQSGPLAQARQANSTYLAGWLTLGSFTGLFGACLVAWPNRKRRAHLGAVLGLVSLAIFLVGCGGSSHTNEVNSSATTTLLTASSANPALGSEVTLNASVAPVSGGGTPTGTVTFQSGTNVVGTAVLSGGRATYATSSLPVGVQSMTATYSGDSSYTPSSSAAVAVDVTLSANISVKVADNSGNMAVQTLAVTVK